MSAQKTGAHAADTDGKWMNRVGGICAIVFGIAYVVIIALYLPVGRPTGVEEWLTNLGRNTTAWWAIVGLSVLTDLLLIPIALSLYLTLNGLNRNAMLAATAFVGLFVVLDLTLTWTNIASLLALSGDYAAATGETKRAVILTAAYYPTTVLESNLTFVYNSLTLAVGILITGLVMLKGIFNKSTAFLGLAAGVLGIAAVIGSFFASSVSTVSIIFASVLTTVWVLFVGYRLYRLGRV